jgi:hypothetical protein
MIGNTLVSTFKQHKTAVLMVLAGGQLAVLLTMPATLFTLKLLGLAITHGYALYTLFAPALLICGLSFNKRLRALNWRWLEWSPWGIKANLALAPMEVRFLWLPYALVLGCCIPILAFLEEEIFRNGTHNWLRGLLWGGVAFGLVHLLSCVTVRMTLYLTLVGVALVGVYMKGGLVAVFVAHASYNLLVLALVSAEQHLPRTLRVRLGQLLPTQAWRRAIGFSAPVTVGGSLVVSESQPLQALSDGIDRALEGQAVGEPLSLTQAWPQHPRPTRQKAGETGAVPPAEAAPALSTDGYQDAIRVPPK